MAMTKTRVNTVKKAETAIRELGLTRVDKDRLHKIHQGMRVLDDEQAWVRNEIWKLVTIHAKLKNEKMLVAGLEKILNAPEMGSVLNLGRATTKEEHMAKNRDVRDGLAILGKYDPEGNMGIGYDEIYAGGPGPEAMSGEDAKALAELGWRFDSKLPCWAKFV